MSRLAFAARLLPAGLCLLGACRATAGGDRDVPEVQLDPVALLAREVVPEVPISPEADGFGFAHAVALRFDGDRMVVLENGNSRLVVFDSTLRPVATIGRPGAGPGEMRGVYQLGIWQDEYAVSDVNNARISIFGADHVFRRSVPVPNALTYVDYGSDGTLYVCAYDGRNYLLAVDRQGLLRPFAERPWDLYPDDVLTAPVLPSGPVKFAVTDSGTVHVYDPYLGALVKFGPAGQRLDVRRLPHRILEGLTRHRELVLRDFGGSRAGALPVVTSLTATDDGRLLVLFPSLEGMFGLLVDAAGYGARALRWGPELDPALAGMEGVVHRGRLYRLSSDDVRTFRLEPASGHGGRR